DRVLAKDSSNATALEGRKKAQKRISADQDAEKRHIADEARREERAKAKDNEAETKARLEARRKADEEDALPQQARLLAEKRAAEERARLAEEKLKAPPAKVDPPVAKVDPPTPAPT